MNWARQAEPIITGIIADNPAADRKTLRSKIAGACPFRDRGRDAVRAWYQEMNQQLNQRFPGGSEDNPNQLRLF